jgi:hypothetical protein
MNRSQTHECRNWERVSFLGIHISDFYTSQYGSHKETCLAGGCLYSSGAELAIYERKLEVSYLGKG